MISFTWDIEPEQIYYNALVWSDTLIAVIKQVLDRRALEVGLWMQANAPWTDRTGRARAFLTTDVVEIMGQALVMNLRHGVSYGLYLETTQGGKYAIIAPALDYWGPIIMQDVKSIVRLASGKRR